MSAACRSSQQYVHIRLYECICAFVCRRFNSLVKVNVRSLRHLHFYLGFHVAHIVNEKIKIPLRQRMVNQYNGFSLLLFFTVEMHYVYSRGDSDQRNKNHIAQNTEESGERKQI